MLQKWYRQERQKLEVLDTRQKAEYIWQYYKLWIIGILCGAYFLCFTLYTALFVPKENWLYLVLANVPPQVQAEQCSSLQQSLADFAGYDLHEKNLVLDTDCYCFPSEEPYNNHYYDKLIALLDGGILDALVMEASELETLGKTGRLLDLQSPLYTVSEKWSDRLIYLDNNFSDYEKERIPIAIDLTGSLLDEMYPDGCAIALSAASQHPQELDMLLSFLFSEG